MFARIIKIAPTRDGARIFQEEGNGNWLAFTDMKKTE